MTPFAPIPSARALLGRLGRAALRPLGVLAAAALLSLWLWRTFE